MLLYSHTQVKKLLEPLINEYLGIKIQGHHKLKTNQIISELIPLNKDKRPWEEVFMKHLPYYYIYGMNKRNYKMVAKQEAHKLERIVIRLIHRNIPIELLPLDASGQPKIFEELPIQNYILFYCLLMFSGNWEWLMQELDLIKEKVPGLEYINWPEFYCKYSVMFRKIWGKEIDL